ncbi:MAG: hypothetical protein HYU39_05640 [Thaumarchaeota archaeon]|nr:hypothetical protein [Nitrososphaerota archaeon]
MIEVVFTILLALLVVGFLLYLRRSTNYHYSDVESSQRSSNGSLYAASVQHLRANNPDFKGSLEAMITILDSKLLLSPKLSGDYRRRANRLRDKLTSLMGQKTLGKEVFASTYSEYAEIARKTEEKGGVLDGS